MDWFKGNFAGKPIFDGKIDSFRLRFFPLNQSNDYTKLRYIWIFNIAGIQHSINISVDLAVLTCLILCFITWNIENVLYRDKRHVQDMTAQLPRFSHTTQNMFKENLLWERPSS